VEIGEEEDTWYDVVYCFDARSGTLLWKHKYLSDEYPFPGPRATPALADGLVYTLGPSGIVHGLRADDGSVVWKRDLVRDGLTEVDHWGMCGSPVVEGDLLLLTAATHGIALDRHTGKVRWRSPPGVASLATPYPFEWNGRRLVAIPGGDKLYALQVESGEVAFTVPWQEDYCLEPVLTGQGLLVPGTEGSVLLRSSDQGLEATRVSREGLALSDHLSFVVLGELVFGIFREQLVCYELSSGKVLWRRPVGKGGALTVAGDRILLLRGDGRLVILAASSEGYKEVASGVALKLEDNRGKPVPERNVCWTMPVLADGRIYARCNHGKLACIDVGVASAPETPSATP
jgi:outer membrane protein assembly factor BamB